MKLARVTCPPHAVAARVARRGHPTVRSPSGTLITILTLCLSGCGGGITPPTADLAITPEQVNDGWPVGEASQLGMDAELLKDMFNAIKREDFTGIDGVVIARSGHLVFEAYFDGHHRDKRHDLRSATKSFTSALVGIAIDRQHVGGVDDAVYPHLEAYAPIDNWSAQKAEITVEHLLTMTPGWDCNDSNESSPGNEEKMYDRSDWVRFVLDLPMRHAPGTRYAYCTGGVVVLGELLKSATGLSVDDFARRHLFNPLGITNYHWEYTPAGQVDTGGHIHMTPRDMAKVGQLFLQGGVWQGKQIVSDSWVDRSTEFQLWAGETEYAYLWWLDTYDVAGRSVGTFEASGNGGQHVIVAPSEELVVALTASNYGGPWPSQSLQVFQQYILKSLIAPPSADD